MQQSLQRGPGQIWGDMARHRTVRDVRFGVYQPLDIEIEPHVHEDRHLVFVFGGNYITSAQGAPPVTSAQTSSLTAGPARSLTPSPTATTVPDTSNPGMSDAPGGGG